MAPLTGTTPIPGTPAIVNPSTVALPINASGDDSNVSSLTDLPTGSQEPSMESLPGLVRSLLLQVGDLKSRVVDAEGGRSESRSRPVESSRSVPIRPSTPASSAPAQQLHAPLHSTPFDRPPPPHMTRATSSAALLSFQRQTGPDKQVVREVLERMGTSIYEVIDRIGRDTASPRSDEAFRASVDPGTAPDIVSTSTDPTSVSSSDRFIFVRPEDTESVALVRDDVKLAHLDSSKPFSPERNATPD
ncbi:unnamed protein product, partial [Tilletia controversa]